MFKLTANYLTKNYGIVSTEQFFTDGERETAIHFAVRLEAGGDYTNVRLIDYGMSKSLVPVAVSLPLPGHGVTEFKRRRLDAMKFETVRFKQDVPKLKPVRKPRKVAATAGEFDLPAAAPKKPVSKRVRKFGQKLEAVNA